MDHPLVAHKLTTLRDVRTDSPTFRRLTDELVTLLAYEATRDVRVSEATVQTPLTETVGVQLSRPVPLVVPILRAGLGMLDGMTRLLPTAEVGFLGMVRDEETLQPALTQTGCLGTCRGGSAMCSTPCWRRAALWRRRCGCWWSGAPTISLRSACLLPRKGWSGCAPV